MMLNGPCKDCPRRKLACQSDCEDYKAYLEKYHAIKKFLSPRVEDMYIADAIRKKKKKSQV